MNNNFFKKVRYNRGSGSLKRIINDQQSQQPNDNTSKTNQFGSFRNFYETKLKSFSMHQAPDTTKKAFTDDDAFTKEDDEP